MFRPRVIPVLLLKDNGLVKTIKFQTPTYIGDPINAVKIFNDLEADELVFLDMEASRQNRTIPLHLVEEIGDEAYMPFSVGGGIKSVEQIRHIIEKGAEKVVLNTEAIENPELVRLASEVCGSQSIIVSIDAKKIGDMAYEVYTYGGTRPTGLDPVPVASMMQRLGAGEILINSIDRDGTKKGYDINLIESISSAVRIPVIAMGGAGSFDDFMKVVKEGGASAVAAGSLFVFVGRKNAVLINYPDKAELEEVFA
jgi:cyclase